MSKPSEIGPYRLFGELGRGRHATVYKAMRRDSERPIALKVLRHYDQTTLDKFKREVHLSKSLNISGVRHTYEAEKTREGFIYLAMEYVDTSLKDVLRRQGRPFTRDEAAQLLTPVAQALDTMHQQGLVHLDIKPENILVFADGRAVLADFGITRPQGETTTEGTPRYMSPEQAAGDHPVGPQSDVYALGAVLYEMLTGRPPFQSERDDVLLRQHVEDLPPSPRLTNPQIDRVTARAILAALSKDPRQRPASASALLREVQMAHSTVLTEALDVVRARPYVTFIPAGIAALALMGWVLFRPPSPPPATPPPTRTLTSTALPTATATSAPTHTPTPEPLLPTSTPNPYTPTPSGPTYTPIPPTPSAPPRLLSPQKDSKYNVEMVLFEWAWEGQLQAGQRFAIDVYNFITGERVTCEFVSSHSCRAKIPLGEHGEWRWSVAIEPHGLRSAENHFWRVAQ